MPYILMVMVIGLPIFFSELFVGQYGGLGPIKGYTRLAPFFHGAYIIYFRRGGRAGGRAQYNLVFRNWIYAKT